MNVILNDVGILLLLTAKTAEASLLSKPELAWPRETVTIPMKLSGIPSLSLCSSWSRDHGSIPGNFLQLAICK